MTHARTCHIWSVTFVFPTSRLNTRCVSILCLVSCFTA